MKSIKFTDTHQLLILEKGETYGNSWGKSGIWDKNKISFTSIEGNLASEVTEEQARDILYPNADMKIPELCLTIIEGFIAQALKSEGMELREGDRPEVTKTWPIKTYRKQLKVYQAWDVAISSDRILILTNRSVTPKE